VELCGRLEILENLTYSNHKEMVEKGQQQALEHHLRIESGRSVERAGDGEVKQ